MTTLGNEREASKTCQWQLLAPEDDEGSTHLWGGRRPEERLQGALARERLAQHCQQLGRGHRQRGVILAMLWEKMTYIGAPSVGKIDSCLLFCIWRFAGLFCRLQKFGVFSKRSVPSMATDYGSIILENSICISASGYMKGNVKKR